jgi:3',5'-cyclic AMP phosphodiesterase CpdA
MATACGVESWTADRFRVLRRWRLAACASLLVAASPAGADAAVPAAAWEFDDVERVIAISDIHGAYQAFVETLRAVDLVDPRLDWSGGRTHLVIVGDIVDRGDDSRAAMDLLMRLEPQAAAAGGRVHVVLGNHELMNLVGDLRYVSIGEFRAFAAEEPPLMRNTAYARHIVDARRAGSAGRRLSREQFDERFPPGFFAHREAFSASGTYGRWLLGKPLALRINDTLFAHAGLSEALATLSLEAINGPLRGELVAYVQLLEQAIRRERLDPTVDFYDLASRPDAQSDATLRGLLSLQRSLVHESTSPLWYRGNVGCGPLIEQERLARVLAAFGSRRVVIGHTPTLRRQVWRRLDDQVLLIDAGMLHSYYAGRGAALQLQGDSLAAFYQGTTGPHPVDALPARMGALSANLSPDELETALAEGRIIARRASDGGELLTLRWQDSELEALFTPAAAGQESFPEVAAYRVDRLLDLAMVPTAVVRSIDGRRGTLQHQPRGMVSEARRAASRVRLPSWCPMDDQLRAATLMDALIANGPRKATTINYSISAGGLALTGHQAAFGTGTAIPRRLKGAGQALNGLWRLRLAGLESADARRQLLEVLTPPQYEALLLRARLLAGPGD